MTAEIPQAARPRRAISAIVRDICRSLGDRLLTIRSPFSDRAAWPTEVDQVIRELEDLNSCTERDFLEVGEKLLQFRSMSRRIAADTAAVTQLLSGDHCRNAALALTRILELSSTLNAQVDQNGETLAHLRDHSSRIRLAFTGLGNTVAIFRNLCTLTRIETSRLGNTGDDFGDLAAETTSLSESMKTCGDGVLRAVCRLDKEIQAAARRGSELNARELVELPTLVAAVNDCLRAFEERCRRALETSTRQEAEYESLTLAVDDVVRVVQFHDITRQQVEHVVQALRQLCPVSPGITVSVSADAGTVLSLQSSQLGAAAGLFASSIDRTGANLASMAGRVENMAEASQALMGSSEQEQDSFFLKMEGHFTAILKMLRACTAVQEEMLAQVPELEETVRGMLASVEEVRGIEIRIQRISINAVIRALHLREAGSGLNVIAEIMGGLALESNRNTEDAAAAIGLMRDALRHFSGPEEAGSVASAGTQPVIDEMQRTVLDLHSLGERSYSRVSQIAAAGAQLVAEIDALRGGFPAGPLFARVAEHARVELDRIAATAAAPARDHAGAAQSSEFESLAGRYTMQMERDVHASLTCTAAPAQAPAASAGTTLGDGDFGDNVELF